MRSHDKFMTEHAIDGVDEVPDDMEIVHACGLVEIVHNGSLINDDLEDKSLKRRGDACTYLKYGDDIAVNAGTLMYYAPMINLPKYVKCSTT